MLPHYTMMFGNHTRSSNHIYSFCGLLICNWFTLAWRIGNPHSRTHHFGWETEAAVEKARSVCAITILD
jgi:hypothetical protein